MNGIHTIFAVEGRLSIVYRIRKIPVHGYVECLVFVGNVYVSRSHMLYTLYSILDG